MNVGTGDVRMTDMAWRPIRILKIPAGVLLVMTGVIAVAGMGEERPDDVAEDHWSFRQIVRSPVPRVSASGWLQTPIDAFVLSKLESAGLGPSQPATPRQLVRRISFDLVGLPPTRADVESFERSWSVNREAAIGQLVDRLVSSPHHGERWGRHWLALARYADSNGFEFDFERPNAWHYRDWVIDSLNDDLGYDQFLMQQIAGDELAPRDFGSRVATGFCRHGPTVGNQSLEKNRWDELDDVISTTSEVFLGLTIGCARCHDHKYDPITQKDYYSLLAVFRTISKVDEFVGSDQQRAEIRRLDGRIREVRKRVKNLKRTARPGRWSARNGQWYQSQMVPNVRLLIGESGWADYRVELEFQKTAGPREPFNHSAGVQVGIRATALKNAYWLRLGVFANTEHELSIEVNGAGFTPLAPKVAGDIETGRWYRVRLEARGHRLRAWLDGVLQFDLVDRRLPAGRGALGNWLTTTRWRGLRVTDLAGRALLTGWPDLGRAVRPPEVTGETTRDKLNAELAELEVLKARLPIAMGINDGGRREPLKTHLFNRGDHRHPGAVVEPAVPAVLAKKLIPFPAAPADAKSTGRRSVLAAWMTRPDNPLVARVMANRIWQFHFGRGLVETPSDFGLNGSEPSHPGLLDWLAAELIQSGWSLKHMHRVIMASSVYQQSSGNGDSPSGRLFGAFPRRRLEAELIRDAMLAASGSLNRTMHGQGIRPRIHSSVIATSTTRKWPLVRQETAEHWRRSVYVHVRRSVLMPLLESFDAPPTTESCAARVTTTVPTQALQLLNDRFANEQSRRMAESIRAATGKDVARQVELAFWRTLSRPPEAAELRECVEFVNREGLSGLCHVLFNINEFVFVD